MSTVTNTVNTTNQMVNNYNTTKVFIGENTFENGTYTNGTGSSATLVAGTLMGRVSASGILIPLVAAATDNSQFPVGVLVNNVTVADTASAAISICVSGRVNANALVLHSGNTLETVISGRRLRDRIAGDTLGIKLTVSTENTSFDN